MAETIFDRFRNAWEAFFNKDPTGYRDYGASYGTRPDRPRFSRGNERSIVTAIYNRIALDVADLNFQHVQLDKDGRYKDTLDTGLNTCLNLEANIDQTGRAFIQDIVMSMFDEGCVAVVATDSDIDPKTPDSLSVLAMRTGKIVDWYPQHVRVRLYNETKGLKQDVLLHKSTVAIIENPFYAVMNEPNSTMQRLIRKLNLLDAVDEQSGSGKLDLIIQLPYTIKSDARRQQAEKRRKDIEMQLTGSKYGIAYTDATERITQLNRPLENNLLKQIEYLTSMLFSQLGMQQSILDGTADEATMINYNNRIVKLVASAIVDEFKRKFITKTARTQGKSIQFYIDPFKLATIQQLAESADKFTRNEIMSKNEFRQVIGMKPSNDPKADQLINSNIAQPNNSIDKPVETKPSIEQLADDKTGKGGKIQNE